MLLNPMSFFILNWKTHPRRLQKFRVVGYRKFTLVPNQKYKGQWALLDQWSSNFFWSWEPKIMSNPNIEYLHYQRKNHLDICLNCLCVGARYWLKTKIKRLHSMFRLEILYHIEMAGFRKIFNDFLNYLAL